MREFVPKRLADSVAPPPITFAVFLDDGRGYPDIIVADLLRLARTGIDELLAYPAEEGVADQLDKRRFVDTSDSAFRTLMQRGAPAYALAYRQAYFAAPAAMALLSRALERAAASPDSSAFWLAYDEIAAKNHEPLPRLTFKALHVIRALEKPANKASGGAVLTQ